MSLIPCTACAKRVPGKLSHVTAAWNLSDGSRRAYRHKLCVSCFVKLVAVCDTNAEDAEQLFCPGCGAGIDTDLDPVYITSYRRT